MIDYDSAYRLFVFVDGGQCELSVTLNPSLVVRINDALQSYLGEPKDEVTIEKARSDLAMMIVEWSKEKRRRC